MHDFITASDPIRQKLKDIYKPIVTDMVEEQLRIVLYALLDGLGLADAIDLAQQRAVKRVKQPVREF
jgi:hypothetical protein